VAISQKADLTVGREVHGAADPVHPAVPDPALGCQQEGRGDLGVVLALEEAKEPGTFFPVTVVLVVDVGAYAARDTAVLVCQEELDLGVLVEGVLLRGE
jgi:hypothetical protein